MRARRVRAAVFAIFAAIADAQPPRERDLDALNVELSASLGHARVLRADQVYRWGWAGRSIDAPLWGIVRSAADVLTDGDLLRRVRRCGGAGCNWLFLDTSKNRTRQWCSMRSCGNREKARRHYQRTRRPRGETAQRLSS
jgi:predicted RNA-binding Zn ribbon-like protein